MDYLVVNGPGGVPSTVRRVTVALQAYVVSSTGASRVPTPVLAGRIDYTGLHRVVNRYGVTGAGGGTGPSLPTYGQIFPSGR
jgi:hypothetical protein